eukprot:gene8876-1227_t
MEQQQRQQQPPGSGEREQGSAGECSYLKTLTIANKVRQFDSQPSASFECRPLPPPTNNFFQTVAAVKLKHKIGN